MFARLRYAKRHRVNKRRCLHPLVVSEGKVGSHARGRQRLHEDNGRVRGITVAVPDPELALGRGIKRAVEDAHRHSRRQLRVVGYSGNYLCVILGCPIWGHRPDALDLLPTLERAIGISSDQVCCAGDMVDAGSSRQLRSKYSVDSAGLIVVEHTGALQLKWPVIQHLSAHWVVRVDCCHSARHEELFGPNWERETAVAR
jgi:hypothetical protein